MYTVIKTINSIFSHFTPAGLTVVSLDTISQFLAISKTFKDFELSICFCYSIFWILEGETPAFLAISFIVTNSFPSNLITCLCYAHRLRGAVEF